MPTRLARLAQQFVKEKKKVREAHPTSFAKWMDPEFDETISGREAFIQGVENARNIKELAKVYTHFRTQSGDDKEKFFKIYMKELNKASKGKLERAKGYLLGVIQSSNYES